MGKKLDEDMMRMMTIGERFKYIADKKKMELKLNPNVAPNDIKPDEDFESYHANLGDLDNDPPETEPWIDEERSDYDDFSDDEDGGGGESSDDDSNEY